MTYKTLITHVQSDAQGAGRLSAAVALTRDLNATLIGVGAEMIPPAGGFDPFGIVDGQWVAAMREQIEKNLDAAERAFAAAAAGMPHLWRRGLDLPARAVAREARAADLIVASTRLNPDDGYHDSDLGELVITAGRPVLITPAEGGRLTAKRILVAWKDTREARRALSDALPFLQRAEEVVILEVYQTDAEGAEARTSDVAEALRRHGVVARPRITEAAEASVARELDDAAVAIDADLIVSGAYGHSRLNEWIFGGVTRSLLAKPRRFLLLSH